MSEDGQRWGECAFLSALERRPGMRHIREAGESACSWCGEPAPVPREEPWEWHPDGPEAHAMLEKIQDEEQHT